MAAVTPATSIRRDEVVAMARLTEQQPTSTRAINAAGEEPSVRLNPRLKTGNPPYSSVTSCRPHGLATRVRPS
jgi:hypothetical protein